MPDSRFDPAYTAARDGDGPHRILRIDASARQQASTTRRLADRLVDRLIERDGAEIVRRDLAIEPPPLLTEAWIGAAFTSKEERTDAQHAELAVSDALVAELQAADEIVIAVPVYNFSVPAALKAWIDMVARARVTFRYTEDGPVGLLTGKRAWVIVGSGGTELDGPVDFATAWLRHVLGFLGIDDVRVIAADRQMVVGRERIAQAEAVIDELTVDPSKAVAPTAVLA